MTVRTIWSKLPLVICVVDAKEQIANHPYVRSAKNATLAYV